MEETAYATLHADTELGHVHLKVTDLARSMDFYQKAIGLRIHWQEENRARLGAGEADLLVLSQTPDAVSSSGTTGLYHFALLTPSRRALARALQRLADTRTPISGGSDHGVSEALYLDDPDGNGIEIYRDRPKSEWPYVDGKLQMGSETLDYDGILAELGGEADYQPGMESGTILGHMHLHVAHLAESIDFYQRIIGLELQQYYGDSAAFLSAGGYHHHLGINTWAGIGAPPPPAKAVGLRNFAFKLIDQDEVKRLEQRLDAAQVSYERRGADLLVRDPSQNEIGFIVG